METDLSTRLELQQRGLRRCSRCGHEKTLEEFVKQPSQPLGRSYHCKACTRVRITAYRRRLREEAS